MTQDVRKKITILIRQTKKI